VSAHNAPDGLAEVMGLLGAADDPALVGADLADARNLAAVAAVNYLRKHGEAIQRLVEAVIDERASRRMGGYEHSDATARVSASLAQLSDTGRKPE
jgi:hypothetical protein